jgi:hypothetical protein
MPAGTNSHAPARPRARPPAPGRYGYRDPDGGGGGGGGGPGGGGGGGAEEFADDPGAFVPLYLHAHSLTLRRPGRPPVVAVAPLPRHMRALLGSLGWRLPAADAGPSAAAAAAARAPRRGAGRAAARGAAAGALTKRAWQRWEALGGGGGGGPG